MGMCGQLGLQVNREIDYAVRCESERYDRHPAITGGFNDSFFIIPRRTPRSRRGRYLTTFLPIPSTRNRG